MKFSPTEGLNLSVDPQSLPETVSGKTVSSGWPARLTNLMMPKVGQVETRLGSKRLSVEALTTGSERAPLGAWDVVFLNGVRHEFAAQYVFKEGVEIAKGIGAGRWGTTIGTAYNSDSPCIFATNGTSRFRVQEGTIERTGLDAPKNALGYEQVNGWVFSFDWEKTYHIPEELRNISRKWTLTHDRYEIMHPWEQDHLDGPEPYPNGWQYSFDWEKTNHIQSDDWAKAVKWTETFGPYEYMYPWEQVEVGGFYEAEPDVAYAYWFELAMTSPMVDVCYTFCRLTGVTADDWESNPSPKKSIPKIATAVAWEDPDDPLVTHVRIYRQPVSGGSMLLESEHLATDLKAVLQAWDVNLGAKVITSSSREKDLGDSVREWGIDAPTATPVGRKATYWTYSFDWEKEHHIPEWSKPRSRKWTTTKNDYEVMHSWEGLQINDETITTMTRDYAYSFWFERYPNPGDSPKYKVCYTYCRVKDDVVECESNPSPIADLDTIDAVEWAESDDPQVTHVRLYRSLTGFAQLLYDSQHPVGDTTAPLEKWDEALGAAVETNHDRPPLGGHVVYGPLYNGVYFILVGNKLHYCLPQRPEYWPALYWIEVSPPDKDLLSADALSGQLYVCSDVEIYAIQGTGPTSFFPLPMKASSGTRAPRCFMSIRGRGVLHLGSEGLLLFGGGGDTLISRAIDPLFRGEYAGGIPPVDPLKIEHCWLGKLGSKIFFAYTAAGSSAYAPTDVIVFDLDTHHTRHHKYSAQFWSAVASGDGKTLMAAGADRYVWELETGTNDNGTAISWEIESKSFGYLRKFFPRSARYDADLIDGSATAKIYLNESVKQEHVISLGRNTARKRLIGGCTGDRLSVRVSGTGRVKFYSAEVE